MAKGQSMADYKYINTTGVIVPDTETILTDVQNEYKTAFGQDLVVTPDTPQGILIAAETIARDEVVRNNAALANQMNPDLAGGIFLDALLALTGAKRNPEVRTTVVAQINGVNGTVVQEGSLARDSVHSELFESQSEVTLTGSPISVTFRAINPGPIDVAINTLTQIVSSILGWETITNAAIGIPGTTKQSDASARSLRKVTLASQGSSLPLAIISAVYLVEDVRSLAFRENVTSAPVTIDGVVLSAHSIYLCVDGGDDTEVATAILSKKSGGCDYNGSTTVPVVEPASGQTYDVTFDRPTAVPILVRVTVKTNETISNPEITIKQAILDYANGVLNGERGFIVGASVSCFELAGAVTFALPGIYVKKVETTDNIAVPAYSTNEIAITIQQKATVELSSITVVFV
jgi:uncharacterized phage protein gp47/JayE